MMEKIKKMRQGIAESDAKRDAGQAIPEDVTRYVDLTYGPYPAHHRQHPWRWLVLWR